MRTARQAGNGLAITFGLIGSTLPKDMAFLCAQVLGALASVLSIWLVTGILVYEAIDRVVNPVRVNGKGAMTGAAVLQPSSRPCSECLSHIEMRQHNTLHAYLW